MGLATGVALAGSLLGALPLLAFAFFSPGLQSESPWGYITFIFGVITLVLLIFVARGKPIIWVLVVFQTLLLAAVLVESVSDSRLYIGT